MSNEKISLRSLRVLAGLRRAEERRCLVELAGAVAATDDARRSLGQPPSAPAIMGPVPGASFLELRADEHMAWAVWGSRLGRLDVATDDESRARSMWMAASVGRRAVDRLLTKRGRAARATALKLSQRDIDEAASTRWAAGRP
jgi:hypothetical protein